MSDIYSHNRHTQYKLDLNLAVFYTANGHRDTQVATLNEGNKASHPEVSFASDGRTSW